MRYIDIFAGCGGLSVGLQNAGWQGLFAIEKNRDAFSTLKYNLIDKKNHFDWPEWLEVCSHDIKEVLKQNQTQLEALQGTVDLVAGGPPCQGFSLAGKRNTKDERNKLVKSYLKFIEYVKPNALILENVHGFTVNFKGNRGSIKKYSTYVVEKLEELEYKVASYVVDVSEFGVPQKRKRFILIAMRDRDPELVFQKLRQNREPFCIEHGIGMKTTIKDALSDLEKINEIISEVVVFINNKLHSFSDGSPNFS